MLDSENNYIRFLRFVKSLSEKSCPGIDFSSRTGPLPETVGSTLAGTEKI